MAVIASFGNHAIYRVINTGSPATVFYFPEHGRPQALQIDYASGSVPIFFRVNGVADTGSQSGLLFPGNVRTLAVQASGVSFLASGTGSAEVNILWGW